MLLDLGITTALAEDVLRDVFVRTAHKKLSKQLPKVSSSLVALRCGLYRNEVSKRLARRTRIAGGITSDTHKLSQLLAGWHEDPEFLSRTGEPRSLPYAGPHSFQTLVSRYAAYMYPAVVRSELERAGVIVPERTGRLKVVSREYRGKEFDERRLAELGERAKDVLSAIVGQALERPDAPIVLQAMGFNVDSRFIPLLHSAIQSRGKIFMRLLDEELNHESRRAESGTGVRVGVMLVGIDADGVDPTGADSFRIRVRPRRKGGRSPVSASKALRS
jgi:hypothetical protein